MVLIVLCFGTVIPATVVGNGVDILERLKETEKSLTLTSREKDNIENEKRQLERELSQLRKKHRSYLSLRDKKERELLKLMKETAAIEDRVEGMKREIVETEDRINQMERDYEKRQALLNRRVVALYKLGRYGVAEILLESDDISGFAQRLKYLSAIIAADAKLVNHILSLKREKEELFRKQKSQFNEWKQELNRKIVSKRKVEQKKKQFDRLVRQVLNSRELKEKRRQELEEARRDLDKKILSLLQKKKELEEEDLALRKEFEIKKGRLPWPVSRDKMLSPQFHPSGVEGVRIRIPRGNPVKAVSPGKVIFADWMKGFGQIVILDHGGGFFSLYAHLGEIGVSVEDEVKTGEQLGLSGGTGSDQGPMLYFEIRFQGEPVDVKKWLKPI